MNLRVEPRRSLVADGVYGLLNPIPFGFFVAALIVTGFYSTDEKEFYGAPVGLAQDQDGALLIADDVGNIVWVTSETR